jgi:hypothetical protein
MTEPESQPINALWDAQRRRGGEVPIRKAIHNARSQGMRDEQIAGELMLTTEEIARLAPDLPGRPVAPS